MELDFESVGVLEMVNYEVKYGEQWLPVMNGRPLDGQPSPPKAEDWLKFNDKDGTDCIARPGGWRVRQ